MERINKRMEMAALELLQSREKEWDWIQQHIDELKEKYDQKLIAVKDGKIIAVGSFMKEIIQKLEEQGLDPAEIVVEFISKMAIVL